MACLVCTGVGVVFSQAWAAMVDATDTIAGYSAGLTANVGKAGETIVFRIDKPQGGTIEISEPADLTGVATVDFVGFHTSMAGQYSVRAFPQGKAWQSAPQAKFTVYPDSVSPIHSSITTLRDAAPADGKQPVQISVRLVDRHGNVIPNHLVNLISSRTEDKIEAIGSGFTNQMGEVAFQIFSLSDGVSYLSAYDKNSGITLDARAKVVFYAASGSAFSGGNLNVFMANSFLGDDNEGDKTYDKIDHFQIDIVKEAQFGVPTDITITGVDKNDKIVRDYNRMIIIQSTDNLATLPNGGTYQFTDFDEGKKLFVKGITFSEAGTHTITVYDFDGSAVSPNIKGEVTVKVSEECVGAGCDTPITTAIPTPDISPPPIGVAGLEIKKPESNAKFGDSRILITGKGTANSDLHLTLDGVIVEDGNENEVIIPVDGDGFFSYELKNVPDGSHSVSVTEVEGSLRTSDVITFEVDATPPEPGEVSIFPAGEVIKGEMVTITTFSEPNLTSVTVRFGNSGAATELFATPDQPNKYSMSVKAPETSGEYVLNFELKDTMENTTRFEAPVSLRVKSDTLLSAPTNVQALGGPNAVSISWLAPPGEGISGYRVYSGTNQLIVDTVAAEAIAPASSTIVSGLQNGQVYYFTVAAMSQNGGESARSLPVSAVPMPLDPSLPPTDTPFATQTPNLSKNITGIPRNGSIELQWDLPFLQTAFFDVQFGIASGVYSERFSVAGSTRNVIIPDLINNLPYYFTVIPLTQTGVPTGEQYIELRVVPQSNGLHNAPEYPPISGNLGAVGNTPRMGIESFFLLFLSLSFAASMFFFHRAFRYARA